MTITEYHTNRIDRLDALKRKLTSAEWAVIERLCELVHDDAYEDGRQSGYEDGWDAGYNTERS